MNEVLAQSRLFTVGDTVTPLLYVAGLRLLLLNFILAAIEAIILQLFFKARYQILFRWMIAANYISTVAGVVAIVCFGHAIAPAYAPMIFHLWAYILSMFIIAMISSFVLELPFVYFAVKSISKGLRRPILGCAAAQIGSYTILFPIYLFLARVRFYNEVTPAQSLDFVREKSATIFFLSPDLKSLEQIRLDGSSADHVMNINEQSRRMGLHNLTIWEGGSSGKCDLWLTDDWSFPVQVRFGDILLLRNVAAKCPARDDGSAGSSPAVDWRLKSQRDWKVTTFNEIYSGRLGFAAQNQRTGQSIHLCVDTPFISWYYRCVTFISTDQIVFEISGQIVVLDLSTCQLGFLAYGHSPVAILPKSF
jgi:hypothetical protein